MYFDAIGGIANEVFGLFAGGRTCQVQLPSGWSKWDLKRKLKEEGIDIFLIDMMEDQVMFKANKNDIGRIGSLVSNWSRGGR